jgi:hypothetical protein
MVSFLLLLSSIATLAMAVTQLTKFYSQDTTCSNQETLWYVTQVTTCTPSSSCTNLNGMVGQMILCPPSITFPTGWSSIEIWQSSTTCSGASTAFAAMPANGCSGIWTSSTFSLICGTNSSILTGAIQDCSASMSTCGGCSVKQATKGGTCVSGNPTTSLPISSYKWTCPSVATTTTTTSTSSGTTTSPSTSSTTCFHESTLIMYKGQTYSMEQLKNMNHEECRIPHIVRSKSGVIIEATCKGTTATTLQLTSDHLVYSATVSGWKSAGSISVGDIIYYDMEKKQQCTVTRVTQDKSEQTYFGLNCLDSQVLANGILTSTFGRYHWIPSAWMKLAGSVLGVERASKWGDAIVGMVI